MKEAGGSLLRDRRIQTILLIIYDLMAVMLSYFLALWFRFDCQFSAIPKEYFEPYLIFCPFYAVLCVTAFYCFRLYKMVWSYFSYNEVMQVLTVSVCTSVLHVVCITAFIRRMPISYYLMGTCLCAAA